MYGYDSRVRLSEVDQDRRMTLNAILNSFQDCSSFHSEDLGVGAAFVEQKKRMWVLSSWKIVIQRYPELAESIRVETSPYEFSKLTGRRNFRMLDGRGEMLACADSLWVYMDTVRKRPCRLEEDVAGAYTMEPRLTCMEYEDGHIQIPEELEKKYGGFFGFHIHEGNACTGDAEDPFADTKGHYNPEKEEHPRHAGDLPPVLSNDGTAWMEIRE